MKANIIWDNYYGKGDKVALNRFQKNIGYIFPSSYLSICEKHNGAFPDNADTFDIIDTASKQTKSLGVGVFLAHGETEEDYETLENYYLIKPSGLPSNMVPFSLMGDGDVICFNYKAGSEPTIDIWHIETGEAEYVAESFDDFLEALYEE